MFLRKARVKLTRPFRRPRVRSCPLQMVRIVDTDADTLLLSLTHQTRSISGVPCSKRLKLFRKCSTVRIDSVVWPPPVCGVI